MIKNPLEPIEELILDHNRWFLAKVFDKKNIPEKLNWLIAHESGVKKEARGNLTDEELKDVGDLSEINAYNKRSDLLKEAFIECTKLIQIAILNLSSEDEAKVLLRALIDSITFMKNELINSGISEGMDHEVLNSLNDYIIYRYINKGFSKIDDSTDQRLRVGLKSYEIRNYFNVLSDLGIISNDKLASFINSSFYGCDPRMELKEKIVVKTTQANLRFFMYRFKEDNRLFEIDQKRFVKILHESFTCFEGVEPETTYKKMSQKPAKFDLL